MSKCERYEDEKSKLETLLMAGKITPEQYDEEIKKLAKELRI